MVDLMLINGIVYYVLLIMGVVFSIGFGIYTRNIGIFLLCLVVVYLWTILDKLMIRALLSS